MEITVSEGTKRLEAALKVSKETSLTDSVIKTSYNSMSEPNTKVQPVCRICGKALQCPLEFVPTEQNRMELCGICATNEENTITDGVNRRDSGFHTMNRQSENGNHSQSHVSDTRTSVSDTDSRVTDEKYCNKPCTNSKIFPEHNVRVKQYENQSPKTFSAKETVSPKAFAENLFNCNGFKRTEVARILGKK